MILVWVAKSAQVPTVPFFNVLIVSTPGELLDSIWHRFHLPYPASDEWVVGQHDASIEYEGMRAISQERQYADPEDGDSITEVIALRSAPFEKANTLSYFLDDPGWNTDSAFVYDLVTELEDYQEVLSTFHAMKLDILLEWCGVAALDLPPWEYDAQTTNEHHMRQSSIAAEAGTVRTFYTGGSFITPVIEDEELDETYSKFKPPESRGIVLAGPADVSGLVSAVKSLDKEWEYQVGRKGEIAFLRSRSVSGS